MATSRLLSGSIFIPRGPYGCFFSCSSTYSSNSLPWKKIKSDDERSIITKELNKEKSYGPSLSMVKRIKTIGAAAALQTPLVVPRGFDVAPVVALVCKFAQAIRPTSCEVQVLFEKVMVDCRFFSLLAVAGSLLGSVLCFVEGCFMILKTYLQYFHALSQKVDLGFTVQLLIEAIDMFLVGTAMLIFGMGLYVMFIKAESIQRSGRPQLPQSNLFGLFHLQMVPSWLKMQSLPQAKSRVGHAVMLILQVGLLDKFKSIPLVTAMDLACFAGALLVSSASIFVLSKLSLPKLK